MDHPFEVGDIVTGKQSATHRYGVTICGTMMRVEEVHRNSIRVCIIDVDEELAAESMKIEGRTNVAGRIRMIKQDIIDGSTFGVDADYFEIYSYPTLAASDELSSFLDDM